MLLNEISDQVEIDIKNANDLAALDDVRVKYLGKKGVLPENMRNIAKLSGEEKKAFGMQMNQLKTYIISEIDNKKQIIYKKELDIKLKSEVMDVTIPPKIIEHGKIHPITQVIDEIMSIFSYMGFNVETGPEIEDDFHNFTALNIPPNHPARQMQDTFYLAANENNNDADDDKNNDIKNYSAQYMLRTHTSPVQIRIMQSNEPPYKIISPGRVYRCDSDMTHTPMFHQVEGLYIDKKVNMAHLKGCVSEFLELFFEEKNIPIRFRPSFFPFTEPSAEVDIGCNINNKEIKIGKGNEWLEILGCGMVHPNVLKNVGIDTEIYQGFAFGIGVERMAMLKYNITDLRTFFSNDIRWIEHYGFMPYNMNKLIYGI
ncbi:MAG: phenylalanine--tRNA ligase subunit alpha [Pseudomonadota bacterium]